MKFLDRIVKRKQKALEAKTVEDKYHNVDMVMDTIKFNSSPNGITAGSFNPSNNTIKVSYLQDNEGGGLDFSKDGKTVLDHEQKHRDNQLSGMYAYAVGPEQAYKRNMHDEISAHIAQLLSLREKYIETGDLNVLLNDDVSRFYYLAVAKGKINPLSPYQEDFDKEMSFIVNGVQQEWMKNYSSDYIDQNLHSALDCDRDGKYAPYWDENYQNALKIAYDMGGVDFTKYMKKDVEIPEAGYKALCDILSAISNEDFEDSMEFDVNDLPKYDGSITLGEYRELLQHHMAMSDFKEMSEYLDPADWKEEMNACRQNAYEKGEFINRMVKYQAKEYLKSGKDFQTKRNPQNYQKELDKIYCGDYAFLKPEVSTVITLSEKDEQTLIEELKGRKNNLGVEENKDPVQNWLQNNTTKQQAASNEVFHPINTQNPEYPKWKNEDGSRVSEVQYRPVLDLTRPVIDQPTLSKNPIKNIINMMKSDAAKASKKAQKQASQEKQSITPDLIQQRSNNLSRNH